MTDVVASVAVQFRVLGPLAVDVDGEPAVLGGPRQRLVLALLVQAAPGAISADRLIDGVWGDDAPTGARGTLQTYVSHLRSALGGGIETGAGGYALDVPKDVIDASRFEALVGEGRRLLEADAVRAGELLREGLGLWVGRPYADLQDEPALRAEVTRLEQLRLSALEDRISADLALGAHSELVSELEVLTAEYPLRERFRAQHMLALYRSGRQADALRAYQRTRDVLIDELGIDPSAELRDLEERILRQDPTLTADLAPQIEERVLLFTDLEDSTVLWELHPDHMPGLLAEHDRILSQVVEGHEGRVFKTTGDGICAVFDRIGDAVGAASVAQQTLSELDTGEVDRLAVRCSIDVGDVESRGGDFFGPVLNRCARIMASGHGGQVLLSADAQTALTHSGEAGWATRGLGEYRFKGLGRPQQVFQLVVEGLPAEFPPLRIDRLPPPLPGTAFGRTVRGYELREQIGAGDFGIVYRAYQPTVGREVAVKVIRPEYVDQPAFVRRFEAEAQLVAQLEHPHIVPLYDYWRDPDGAYLVFRWLRGGSLRQALERGPFHPEAAMRLLEQVGGALAYAHRLGVAHRDLKPGNVLLDDQGDGFLTDFGIAIRLVDASETGRPYTTSPAYLAPEELRGEPVTISSDLHALGLLTFEVFTGRQPPMDGALPPLHDRRSDLPEQLTAVIERATAEDPVDRFGTVEAFLTGLRQALGETAPAAPVAFTATRNPYKGLYPFQEGDTADFYGRTQLIQDLVTAVGDHRLVAVVGPSGLGKSSVVRAGLIPALRAGGLPGSREWLFTTMFPGTYPFEELEAALVAVADDWPAHAGEELRADERGLVRVSKQVIPDGTSLVLIIDQFEELFTLTRDETTRRLFLDTLVQLVADERSRVRVVLTLRADHFDRPLRYFDFGELIKTGLVTVVGLSDQELTDAILKPAHGVRIGTEPGLERRILTDIQTQPGALPLLQYSLTELFANRHSDQLTVAGYEQTGGLLGALSHRAEGLFEGFDATGRQVARQVFLRLVNVGEEREDTRRRVRRSELESLEVDRAALDHVLKTYGDHRLLSFDRDPITRGPTVEVAHEALLTEWNRLETWIDERREDLLLHRRLTEALDEYQDSDRDPSYLLAGGRLAQLETLADSGLSMTPEELSFLDTSRRREHGQKLRRRRLRRIVMGSLVALTTIASGFGIYAVEQRTQARSRELAASAINILDEDPELSLLLALEAAQGAGPTFESVSALHEAVLAHRTLLTMPVSSAVGTALLPDYSALIIVDPLSRTVEAIDPDTGVTFWRTELPANVTFGAGFDVAAVRDRSIVVILASWVPEPPNENALAPTPHQVTGLLIFDTATGDFERRLVEWPCALESLFVNGNGWIDLSTSEFPTLWVVAGAPNANGECDGMTVAVLKVEDPLLTLPGDSRPVEAIGQYNRRAFGEFQPTVGGWGDVLAFEVDDQIRVISVQSPVPPSYLGPHKPNAASTHVLSEEGGLLAVVGFSLEEAPSGLLDLRTDSIVQHLNGLGPSNLAWFSADGALLLTAGIDGDLRLWDIDTGSERLALKGAGGPVDQVHLSADATRLVSKADRVIKVWSLLPIGEVGAVDMWESPEARARGRARSDFSAANLNISGGVGAITYWGEASSNAVLVFAPNTGDVSSSIEMITGDDIALSADGRYVAAQEEIAPGRLGPVWIHDTDNGERLVAMKSWCLDWIRSSGFGPECMTYPGTPFADVVYQIEFSPAGSFLAATGRESMSLTVWESLTGELVFNGGNGVGAIAYGPHGDWLASGQLGQSNQQADLVVYETEHWADIGRIPNLGCTLGSLRTSPDGDHIVAVCANTASLKLFDIATWSIIDEADGLHDGQILDVEISPDGSLVATAGADGIVRIFDASNLDPTQTIPVADGPVSNIEFIDATHLFAIPGSGPGLVLTTSIDELISVGRRRLSRTFTPEECQSYRIDPCPDLETIRNR